jgi:hypothetical protein
MDFDIVSIYSLAYSFMYSFISITNSTCICVYLLRFWDTADHAPFLKLLASPVLYWFFCHSRPLSSLGTELQLQV